MNFSCNIWQEILDNLLCSENNCCTFPNNVLATLRGLRKYQGACVQNLFFNQKFSKFLLPFLLTFIFAILPGCGPGKVGTSSGATTGASGVAATPAATPIMSIALANNSGTPVTSISTNAPANVTVTLKDATGAAMSNTIVTFSTASSLATISPASSVLTNAAGVATVTLSPANATVAGAATLTATAQSGSTPVTASANYSVVSAANTLVPNMSIALANNSGTAVSAISSGTPATVTTTLLDSTGAAIPNTIVTFSTDVTLATLSASTVLTNAAGVASVTLSPATSATSGAATILATAQVGTTAASASKNFSVTPTAAPSMLVTLSSNSISSGSPATVTATLKDASGVGIPNTVVTFSTNATLATLTPAYTMLTNSSGVATGTLSALSLNSAGAATITATSQLGTTVVTGSSGYSVGAVPVTISTPVFGLNPLSAFGTTSVAVTVSSGGVPITSSQTVTFSSPCASSGNALLTSGVATKNGIATASYRDNGCASTDSVTASVNGTVSSSATLTVTPPSTGSIQFVSATPTSISLKGTGGTGRQETSQVVFKVVDTGGNPIGGKTVSFSLSTIAGGITFANGTTSATAISDATTGQVLVTVNSGTVNTPLRVLASTAGVTGTLTTQSDQLSITTGIPDQANFSLSATKHNIEGWNIDGTTSVLTVRMADHFGNPVPDGTAVTFTTEGGLIAGNPTVSGLPVGSCLTVNSQCSATFTSQALRPTNGRITILATAIGEESFTDLNNNGYADPGEMTDVNGFSTDIGYAYVDYNETGVRDAGEPYIDFYNLGSYLGTLPAIGTGVGAPAHGDGLYHGVLCNPSVGASFCSTQKSIDVRGSQVIVLSGSAATIAINGGAAIGLSPCASGVAGTPLTFNVNVVDVNGNAMPVGSTVNFTSSPATTPSLITSANYVVPDSTGCQSTGYAGCPASVGSTTFGNIPVTMQSGVSSGACLNATGSSGTFTVTVTTPSGVVTTKNASLTF